MRPALLYSLLAAAALSGSVDGVLAQESRAATTPTDLRARAGAAPLRRRDDYGRWNGLERRQQSNAATQTADSSTGGVTVSLPAGGSDESSTQTAGTTASTAQTSAQATTGTTTNTQAGTSAGTRQDTTTAATTAQTSAAQSNPAGTSVTSGTSDPNTATTPVGSTQPSSTTPQTTSSSASVSSAASSSSVGSATTSAQGVSTVIITTTASDGEVLTSASLSTAPAASDTTSTTSSSSSSNSKAWIIPLSVVAGIIALAGALFIGYRCTQRRFSELDDDDVHGSGGIRWPELLKKNGDETTTLNPLGTHRRHDAAGIGADLDDDNAGRESSLGGNSDFNQTVYNEKHLAAVGLAAPGMAMSRSGSSAGSSSTAVNNPAMNPFYTPPGHMQAHPAQGYYDPYLGAPGNPFATPRSVSPLPAGGAPYYDPSAYPMQQQQPPHSSGGPPSPLYPPSQQQSSRPISPFGPAAGAAAGAGQGMRSMSPGPQMAMNPLPSSPMQQQQQHVNGSPTSPRLSMTTNEQQPSRPGHNYRLSVANPDGAGYDSD